MLNRFKGVVEGKIKDYAIKATNKLIEVAESLEIETEGRGANSIAVDLCSEMEKVFHLTEGEIPFVQRVPKKLGRTKTKLFIVCWANWKMHILIHYNNYCKRHHIKTLQLVFMKVLLRRML